MNIATGTVDVVARANDALRFADLPDGRKIVFARGTHLCLETIAP